MTGPRDNGAAPVSGWRGPATIRSPLLEAGVRDRWRFRRRVVLAVSSAAAFVALISIVTSLRLIAVGGWWDWAYWIHDHVFLTLKGYLWTLAFPFAIVLWVTAFVIICVALANAFVEQPVLQRAHVRLTRYLLAGSMRTRLVALPMLRVWLTLTRNGEWGWRQLWQLCFRTVQEVFDRIHAGDAAALRWVGAVIVPVAQASIARVRRVAPDAEYHKAATGELLLEYLALWLVIAGRPRDLPATLNSVFRQALDAFEAERAAALADKEESERYTGPPARESGKHDLDILMLDFVLQALDGDVDRASLDLLCHGLLDEIQSLDDRVRTAESRLQTSGPLKAEPARSANLRVRLYQAIVVGFFARAYWLAEGMLARIEALSLSASLRPGAATSTALCSRDYATVGYLVDRFAGDESEALRTLLRTDSELFSEFDLAMTTLNTRSLFGSGLVAVSAPADEPGSAGTAITAADADEHLMPTYFPICPNCDKRTIASRCSQVCPDCGWMTPAAPRWHVTGRARDAEVDGSNGS